jgi:hypothetical protein
LAEKLGIKYSFFFGCFLCGLSFVSAIFVGYVDTVLFSLQKRRHEILEQFSEPLLLSENSDKENGANHSVNDENGENKKRKDIFELQIFPTKNEKNLLELDEDSDASKTEEHENENEKGNERKRGDEEMGSDEKPLSPTKLILRNLEKEEEENEEVKEGDKNNKNNNNNNNDDKTDDTDFVMNEILKKIENDDSHANETFSQKEIWSKKIKNAENITKNIKENNVMKSTSQSNSHEENEKDNDKGKDKERVECKVCREQPQLQAVFGFSQIFWMLCFSSVFVYGK